MIKNFSRMIDVCASNRNLYIRKIRRFRLIPAAGLVGGAGNFKSNRCFIFHYLPAFVGVLQADGVCGSFAVSQIVFRG